VLIIGILFFNIQYPTGTNLMMFILTLINGLIINYFITHIIGLVSFWYTWIWQFNMLLSSLVKLFSGAFIPLWFFPKTISNAALFLPFRLIYYTPISIYLGKVNIQDIIWAIMQQFLWIVGLYFLERLIWSRAVNKLVVHGG